MMQGRPTPSVTRREKGVRNRRRDAHATRQGLTTALATLLLLFPGLLRLSNQVLALVNRVLLDLSIMRLL